MNLAAWRQDRRMKKFRDVLSRWEAGELSMMEAGELPGMSERQFRRYRGRYEEEGAEGLVDRRLGKRSPKPVPAADARRMLELHGEVYRGRNVKHLHEHLRRKHGFGGLHLGEDAVAHSGPRGARPAAWGAPAQARAQAVRGHDAAPGRLAGDVARGPAGARPDRHDG
jgi:Helix-turn-helix domain